MDLIVLDFETYFDKDYSLRKLSTEAYVRDPRFEVHGAALYNPKTEGKTWVDGPYLQLGSLADSAVLCHHAAFDCFILNHHYGVRPRAILDTLSMSRLLLGTHVKHSLDDLRAHFGLPSKRTPYHLFKGRHWGDLDAMTRREIGQGAIDEVISIYHIFKGFMTGAY